MFTVKKNQNKNGYWRYWCKPEISTFINETNLDTVIETRKSFIVRKKEKNGRWKCWCELKNK